MRAAGEITEAQLTWLCFSPFPCCLASGTDLEQDRDLERPRVSCLEPSGLCLERDLDRLSASPVHLSSDGHWLRELERDDDLSLDSSHETECSDLSLDAPLLLPKCCLLFSQALRRRMYGSRKRFGHSLHPVICSPLQRSHFGWHGWFSAGSLTPHLSQARIPTATHTSALCPVRWQLVQYGIVFL